MVVTFRTQLSQTPQLTLPRTSRVDGQSQLCAWAIVARSLRKTMTRSLLGTESGMEAIVTRIGASFMITTCLRAYPVQRGAQNGDTFDLISSRKRRHGISCQGEREARPERRTTAWRVTQSRARAAPMTVSAARQPSWLKLETDPRP